MDEIVIKWLCYPDFFKLYAAHNSDQKLIYVIGRTHHCYIGSVGSKGGTGGLARRYEKQYLDLARTIFGRDLPENQPAYTGLFVTPADPPPKLIEAVEKIIQKIFLDKLGESAALFALRGTVEPLDVKNRGQVPSFLSADGNA